MADKALENRRPSIHDTRMVDVKEMRDTTRGSRTVIPMILTSAIAGGILTVMAPYGTHAFPLEWRAPYWVGLCIAGGLGAGAANILLEKTRPTLSLWQRAIGQSIGATLCVLSILLGLQYIIVGHMGHPPLLTLAVFVWIISIVICSFGVLLGGRADTLASPPQRPALMERLKPALRDADIYALTAEDHYVRILTSKGEDLILMRLSDAIKEVASLKGLSVHRSWWVAEAGVKTTLRKDGKIILTLKNETQAPVSRSGAKAVREAGWV